MDHRVQLQLPFSHGQYLHIALSNLAFSVGAPFVNEWYVDKAVLDETFARAFRVVLKDYDPVDPLDEAELLAHRGREAFLASARSRVSDTEKLGMAALGDASGCGVEGQRMRSVERRWCRPEESIWVDVDEVVQPRQASTKRSREDEHEEYTGYRRARNKRRRRR